MCFHPAAVLLVCALLSTAPFAKSASLDRNLEELKELLERKLAESQSEMSRTNVQVARDLGVDAQLIITTQDYEDLIRQDVSDIELEEKIDEHMQLMSDMYDRRRKRSVGQAEEIELETPSEHKVHSRQKRAYAMILARGIIGAGRGWRLSQQASEGCASYPSICVETDKIAELDEQIKEFSPQYNERYQEGLADYISLTDCVYNQDFMVHAIDESIESLQHMHEDIDKIGEYLSTDFDDLIDRVVNGEITHEEFAELALAPMQTLFGTMRSLIVNLDNLDTDVGQQMAVKEMLADAFGEYLRRLDESMMSHGFTLNDGRLNNIVDVEQQLDMNQKNTLLGQSTGLTFDNVIDYAGKYMKGALQSMGEHVETDLPYVSDVFKSVATRPFLYLAGNYTPTTTNIFHGREVFNNYRAAMLDALRGVLLELQVIHVNMTSPTWNQFSSANYKLSFDEILNARADAQYDHLESLMATWHWADVAAQMTEIRETFEDYAGNLTFAMTMLNNDIDTMQEIWEDVIEHFQDMGAVIQMIIDAGSTGSDLQIMNALNPGFTTAVSTYFGEIAALPLGKGDLRREQTEALTTLRVVTEGYRVIGAHVAARSLFFERIIQMVNDGETVLHMSELITEVLSLSIASETREFSDMLQEQIFVCVIGNTYPSQETYDFFDLAGARALCNAGVGSYDTLSEEAQEGRYWHMMHGWIASDLSVSNDITVADLLSTMQREFTRIALPGMDTFSASLSSKEIVCVVQQIVTTDYYDNYELAVFRSTYASGGDCDDIADHDWALVTHNKQRLDYVNSMITMELDLCNRWLFCECWPNLKIRYALTDAELILSMTTVDPSLDRYCGGSPWFSCPSPECITLT